MKKFVIILLSGISGVLFGQSSLNIHPDLVAHLDSKLAPFYHGVASGDPTENSVILWTKVTLDKSYTAAQIAWELATDSLFNRVIKKGEMTTDDSKDFIIKPDVSKLKPNTQYYYRFQFNGVYSIVGRTKTLPSVDESIDIVFASCSNYEWGYFNNYRFIAEDPDIDLVVHLGDYIYEYGIGNYGDVSLGRLNVPAHEIKTLYDYRTRYSLYRLDKDLIKAHQMKPFVATWDDHEIANNAYDEGAQNHQQGEGEWSQRAKEARQAYYEWLPIRKKGMEPLYRSFQIGNLIELIILDTRLGGRTKQVDHATDPDFQSAERTILGEEQYRWLKDQLTTTSTWKIIGNQVPFGPLYFADEVKADRYMDGWDGYPQDRKRLIQFLKDEKINNVVFVTGDFHESFALENDLEGTATADDNVAVELVVTSITSANDDEYEEAAAVSLYHDRYLANNPHMKYCNNKDHGYVVLHVTKEKIEAEFVYASTVKQPKATKSTETIVVIPSGKAEISIKE